ncbi:MAG TPA: hypothetical protein VM686_05735 [Polyangiaceae bacterium]|nr:hypothetical protein [Polyangiaceae bacterium]
MSSPYLSFGLPHDVAAYVAVAAALGWLALGKRALRARHLVGVLCLLAGLLSAGYVVHYLRGGPRIIDATSYWLEARNLAGGALSFEVPDPASSFRGRFLVTAPGDAQRLSVIFPPGYPALLALGFLAHAPLLVGPLLAALLVLSTYWLCRELTGREDVARLAALISALCAALRYHTADTMSHGLSALLFSVSLAAAARGGPTLLLCGLALGWLTATRPLSGAVALVVCAAVALLRHGRRALLILPALIPGIALLLYHQRAATGDWWSSTQLRYYALADGPPGCFRWGFGDGIGCLYEHGDFVRARLQHGYGALEAALNSMRRLALHGIDIANFVPLSLLVPFALVRYRRTPGVLPLGLGALALIVAYAGFYFDGSYPGGGARLYADVLPLEHALLALALLELRLQILAPAAMLLGFALHAVHGHRALAEREGGRPMFEPETLATAGVKRGLVFVSSDHAFNLGHDPVQRDPWHGVLVARARGDARDALLWERFGRPPAFRHRYDASRQGPTTPIVESYVPERSEALRFESEAEWPLLSVSGGYGHPDFAPYPCVSAGRGLRVVRTGTEPLSVKLEITPRDPGPHELVIQWLADQTGQPLAELETGANAKRSRVDLSPASSEPCRAQASKPIEVSKGASLVLTWSTPSVLVDYIELRPLFSKMR